MYSIQIIFKFRNMIVYITAFKLTLLKKNSFSMDNWALEQQGKILNAL